MKIHLIVSFMLALYSCQPQEEGKKIISKIPESGTLKSREVSLSNAVLMPSKILVFPNRAVILDNGKKNLFKVYDLPDHSFGVIGQVMALSLSLILK